LWFEYDISIPSSADVKNEWSYTSTPPICLLGVDRDNFTFFIVTSQPDVYVPLVMCGIYLEKMNILFSTLYSCNIHGFFDSGYRAISNAQAFKMFRHRDRGL
jgi:hypothetical protein